MIQRFDITRFGCFSNYVWNTHVRSNGNCRDFKKLNILYGRNYSGKTTLSRMLRCLETGRLPQNYESPEFKIKTDSGWVSQQNIDSHSYEIRVFNKDFVDDQLSFLRSEEGNIEPFAVLGEDNTKIKAELRELEAELGSVDSKTGLIGDRENKLSKWRKKLRSLESAKKKREEKLRTKANQDIKQNPELYGDVTYNIKKIEIDIKKVKTEKIKPLSSDEENELRALLTQESMPAIDEIPDSNLMLDGLHTEAEELLSREIKPSKPIQDLLDDALLQAWVKQGIPLHREKRQKCGFCQNPLPPDLWETLDQHFNEASQELDNAITSLIKKIEFEADRVKGLLSIERSEFYRSLQDEFQKVEASIKDTSQSYCRILNRIVKDLRKRQDDLFKTIKVTEVGNVRANLEESFANLVSIAEKQSQITKTLSADKIAAQRKLRLSVVGKFIIDIDLHSIDASIATLEEEARLLKLDVNSADEIVAEKQSTTDNLRKQLRDERRGAEKVNDFLSHYFGHESLKLAAIDDDERETGVGFEIQRGAVKAYNLSEGECSLIAFCYFMAKLQDAETQGKELIIYIDDPISSLDCDHIFFAFSLIQGLIASPVDDGNGNLVDRYQQLFISTHNLDFLKYLKRLFRPRIGGTAHFLFVRTQAGSILELMPKYLRQYVTEFHYLFDQVCACTDSSNIADGHHCFFSFGNNLRKLLEIYLFFRFPFCENSEQDHNVRLKRFFDDDPSTEPMVMRLSNELSHVGAAFDRSVRPIDYSEISKLAVYILKKMKHQDSRQYEDLLQATGRDDPLESL